jgi:hypothetical protein
LENRLTVVVFDVHIIFGQQKVCDGEWLDFKLDIEPPEVLKYVTNISFSATKPDGSTFFDNPAKRGIDIVPATSNILDWKVENMRWYSTQGDHCNVESDYRVQARVEMSCATWRTAAATCTASAVAGGCFDGGASPVSYYGGEMRFITNMLATGCWAVVVTQNTFHRDVQASSWWQAPTGSQFYAAIAAEEKYHEVCQFENPTNPLLADCWIVSNVLAIIDAQQPFVNTSPAAAGAMALKAVADAIKAEEARSANILVPVTGPRRCQLEREAKQAARATYIGDMPCTYPMCP